MRYDVEANVLTSSKLAQCSALFAHILIVNLLAAVSRIWCLPWKQAIARVCVCQRKIFFLFPLCALFPRKECWVTTSLQYFRFWMSGSCPLLAYVVERHLQIIKWCEISVWLSRLTTPSVIFISRTNLSGNRTSLRAVISAWKRYDLFMLRQVVQSLPACWVYHAAFSKSFSRPICLTCKALTSGCTPLTSCECILVGEVWILIWMSLWNFPHTPSSKKKSDCGSANLFTEPCIWRKKKKDYNCDLH